MFDNKIAGCRIRGRTKKHLRDCIIFWPSRTSRATGSEQRSRCWKHSPLGSNLWFFLPKYQLGHPEIMCLHRLFKENLDQSIQKKKKTLTKEALVPITCSMCLQDFPCNIVTKFWLGHATEKSLLPIVKQQCGCNN